MAKTKTNAAHAESPAFNDITSNPKKTSQLVDVDFEMYAFDSERLIKMYDEKHASIYHDAFITGKCDPDHYEILRSMNDAIEEILSAEAIVETPGNVDRINPDEIHFERPLDEMFQICKGDDLIGIEVTAELLGEYDSDNLKKLNSKENQKFYKLSPLKPFEDLSGKLYPVGKPFIMAQYGHLKYLLSDDKPNQIQESGKRLVIKFIVGGRVETKTKGDKVLQIAQILFAGI
jgi:hypothetical protein